MYEEIITNNGCSLYSLNKLAQSKGYTLVCYNLNGIFVRNDFVDKLKCTKSLKYEDIWVPGNVIVDIIQRVGPLGRINSSYYYMSPEYRANIAQEFNQLY